jgi:hypothetical protein
MKENMMSKRRTTDKYWYHSYSKHNDKSIWYLYHCKPNYGGYTLEINPEVKVVSIAICTDNDRFSRKEGRLVARERYETAVGALHYDGDTWYILTPELFEGKEFTATVRIKALMQALELITVEHGGKDTTIMTVKIPKPPDED